MASIYADEHRALQQEFGTTKLADMLDQNWIHETITDEEKAFIEGRDMFFLSTVDPEGNPTVSYKGGPTGVVKVIDAQTLVFPGYDGNGMFYSMGNIVGQARVGLLFIDFETPHRIRLHGDATVSRDDPLLHENLPAFHGAEFVVRVTLAEIFVNCPRYIHRYQRVGSAPHVPQPGCETPPATWKRIDGLQDVLPVRDRHIGEEYGLLTPDEYAERVQQGRT